MKQHDSKKPPRSATNADGGSRVHKRSSSARPYMLTLASSYEMACVASVIGLVLAVAVAVGL